MTTTKEQLEKVMYNFIALPEIQEYDSDKARMLKSIAAGELMYEMINLQIERIKELENENEVLKRIL
jgi:hypothetical protein